jgi:hypothetical protein
MTCFPERPIEDAQNQAHSGLRVLRGDGVARKKSGNAAWRYVVKEDASGPVAFPINQYDSPRVNLAMQLFDLASVFAGAKTNHQDRRRRMPLDALRDTR